MTDIRKIEGIGETYAKRLEEFGISRTEDLLKKCSSPQGRKKICEKTGISDNLILRWVNHADLFRVKGIGEEYADLLEQAGVDTVPELAQRNAANLYEKMISVNRKKKLVRKPPTQEQVKEWISEAKHFKRVINF